MSKSSVCSDPLDTRHRSESFIYYSAGHSQLAGAERSQSFPSPGERTESAERTFDLLVFPSESCQSAGKSGTALNLSNIIGKAKGLLRASSKRSQLSGYMRPMSRFREQDKKKKGRASGISGRLKGVECARQRGRCSGSEEVKGCI